MVQNLTELEEDPPGPQPWRCFQIGAATARAFADTPWKITLIESSSWSHSFLTEKHGQMYPDVAQAEDRGHHELLNWFCLAGAMAELKRKPDEAVFLESWITNSDKVFAVFRPPLP